MMASVQLKRNGNRMKLSKGCINLVKEFEGYHKKLPNGDCTTYYCPANVLTIGYGCTEGIKPGEVWTHAQAIAALKRELAQFESAVNALVDVDLNQNQFDALVSFAYNCGSGALSKSGLLKKVNAGDFDGAAREFGKWTRGGGRVLPGLVRRRAKEMELFLTPVDAEPEPTMPQRVEPEPDVASPSPTPQGGGVLSSMTFAKVNELADQGSRIAGWIRSVKRWFWGGTITTGTAFASLDTRKGNANVLVEVVREHPFIAMGVVAAIAGLAVYVAIKLVEKFLVTAAQDGRYQPRGGK